jgi:thiamine biosynthesis lipoprotein
MKTSRSQIRFLLVTLCVIAIAVCLRWAFFGFLAPGWSPANPQTEAPQLREFHYAQLHMGMKVQITVWCKDQAVAETACKEAFRRISELESVFSDYDSSSEISRLTVAAVERPITVSDELWDVLIFSRRLNELSSGAFDPTLAPVIALWRAARRSGELPDPQAIKATREKTGFENLIFDEDGKSVQCRVAGMKLDFGGVAKGYIGDQVLLILKQNGIDAASYEAGGDFVLGDAPPNADGWVIDLENGDALKLANCGVAVSGDTVQFVVIDGQRYSHVVDPQTGIGLTTRRMAWVIAPSGMESDALATTGTIMPEADFQALLKRFPATCGWSSVREGFIQPFTTEAKKY